MKTPALDAISVDVLIRDSRVCDSCGAPINDAGKFEESEHPRDPSGKFGSGSGGHSGGGPKRPSRGWKEEARKVGASTPEGKKYQEVWNRHNKAANEFVLGNLRKNLTPEQEKEYNESSREFGRAHEEYGRHLEGIRERLRKGEKG